MQETKHVYKVRPASFSKAIFLLMGRAGTRLFALIIVLDPFQIKKKLLLIYFLTHIHVEDVPYLPFLVKK